MLPRTLLAGLLLLAGAPAAAEAFTAAEIVGALNAQRAANGIPAGIVVNADWSAKCGQHNDYQQQNGGQLTHFEENGKPGYTDGGEWAGRNSVLSKGTSWASGNPFEHAPIHLHQLLAARLAEMGADERNTFVCATTWPGMTRPLPATPVVHSYPGDGRKDVPRSETAFESPFVPGDFVGLPMGTKTGPHLYLMVDGPWGDARTKVNSATLTGPEGAVDVRHVDNFTKESDARNLGQFLPPGGIVIPASPLRGATTYTASVSVTAGGATFGRTWSFTTAGAPPTVSLTSAPSAPLTGQTVTFSSTAADPDGAIAKTEWDLDNDGAFDDATGGSASRSFAAAGAYPVGVRVTDDSGATATASTTVNVQAPPPPPPPPPARPAVVAPVKPPTTGPAVSGACRTARANVARHQKLVSKARKAARKRASRRVKRRRQQTLRKRQAGLRAARTLAARRC